jgi:DeoR family fructose operon transcriptional repressor
MLNEERYMKILETLDKKRNVTVAEFSQDIGVSESTVRRDLNYLHNQKKLVKIFGGATLKDERYIHYEDNLVVRETKNQEEKRKIAEYAANLIEDRDCVYIDAGSTTETMADFIKAKDVIFVTNSPEHNYRLIRRGFYSLLTGGELRIISDALEGSDAISFILKFNFNKGFFGSSAVSAEGGFSTSTAADRALKQAAIKRCQRSFILADASKFDTIAAFIYAGISDVSIITTNLANPHYRELTKVYEV